MEDGDIRKFGLLTADQIEARDKALEWRIQALEKEVLPNGRLGLEARIMGEVRTMMSHMKGNFRQDVVDAETELQETIKRERTEREKQHDANTEKLDDHGKSLARLEKFAYAMGAVFLVFKFFGIENISKIFK